MNDFRKLMEAMEDISEGSETIQVNDSFDFELGEDLLVETGVVAVGPDAIIVQADQKTLDILSEHFILEDFEELTESELLSFPSDKRASMPPPTGQITGKVYGFKKPEDLYAEFEKSKNFPGNIPRDKWLQAAMRFVANKKKTNDLNLIRSLAAELYDQYLQLNEEFGKIIKYSGLHKTEESKYPHVSMRMGSDSDASATASKIGGWEESVEIDEEKEKEYDAWLSMTGKYLKPEEIPPELDNIDLSVEPDEDLGGDPRNLTGRKFLKKTTEDSNLEEAIPDWNKIAMGLKGKDPDTVPLPKAEKGGTGPVMSFPNIYKYVVKHIKNSSIRLTDDPPGEIDDALKKLKIKITGKKRQDLINRVIQQMEDDGTINDLYDDPIYEDSMDEAKYHGREVPLGKKMKGDVKKSKVYVRKPNGKVVKVNFGDKNMRIKKNSPSHRKSFRARHHCENPGPRWKARYWSCKAW
jgi:hypothetical protein